MQNQTQTTTEAAILNSEPTLPLSDDSSIENELETKIITKQITAVKTTAHEELTVSMEKELNYDLIKFNMLFTGEDCKYTWIVYHTPKEVRKHIRNIYKLISSRELPLVNNQNLNPVISQIHHFDKDVINNLPIITEFYLQLFEEPNYKSNPLLLNFFAIGGNSFLKENGGHKPYEGWVEKKVDKHCCRKCFQIFCCFWELCLFKRYNKRWIVLNVDNLFYLDDPMMKEGKVVYFFDKDMKIERDGKDCLKIKNTSMNLNLKFDSFFERENWKYQLDIRKGNLELLSKYNRFEAYTTAKRYNLCQWFIDGKSYFDDLFIKLMSAEKCIYITDWWMSPEVFLKRPVEEKVYIEMAKRNIITQDLVIK